MRIQVGTTRRASVRFTVYTVSRHCRHLYVLYVQCWCYTTSQHVDNGEHVGFVCGLQLHTDDHCINSHRHLDWSVTVLYTVSGKHRTYTWSNYYIAVIFYIITFHSIVCKLARTTPIQLTRLALASEFDR